MKIVMLDRNSVGMDMDVSIFERLGEFEAHDVADRESCKKWIQDANVVIFNKSRLDEDMLKDAPNVQLLCVTATGFDNIDLEYARKRNIAVTNVRNYSTPAVAQHTFALALYVLEKIGYYDDYVKSENYVFNSDDVRQPYIAEERIKHAMNKGIVKNGKRWFNYFLLE